MRWYAVALALGLGLLSGALLTCRGAARQTYHVSDEQWIAMGKIAGITACPKGPALVVAVKRARQGGGLVHIECPLSGGLR